LRCEVCGRKIYGKPYKVVIEGAKLTACVECSKHGKIVREVEAKPGIPMPKTKTAVTPPKVHVKRPSGTIDATQELVEDFDLKIRCAREKLEISHEQLGKKINEKVSVLKKVETGKMKPDNMLAAKLEHALKIELLVPALEVKISEVKIPKPASRELTLGDLIQLLKKKEEPIERKPS